MNGQEIFAAAKALLETNKIAVLDEIPTNPGKPYYRLEVPATQPLDTTLARQRKRAVGTVRVVAVNNTATGSRFLAQRAVDILHGARLGGWPLVTALRPTAPYEEDEPGALRWSSVAEFTLYTTR